MKRKSVWLLLVAVLGASLLFSGCGRKPAGNGGDGGATPGPTPEVVMIRVKGSDTEVNLVQSLVEEYNKKYPHVQIAVTGGGSGVGIAALIDGNIDIANSSRPMKAKEEEDLKAKQGKEAHAIRFAVDGLAVIVHQDNPLDAITLEDLGKVFRGEITGWAELGGPDKAINLYGRQSTSGTYVFFMEKVLKGDYAATMRNMGGNADIVEAVRGDVTGIGYVGIGFATEGDRTAPGLKALKIAAGAGEEALSPVVLDNIVSGKYPLTRPLYQYVIGKPSGAILEFLKFEVSEAGQKIVLEEGFYPITPADREFNQKALQ